MEALAIAFIKSSFGFLIVREILSGVKKSIDSRLRLSSLLTAFSFEVKSICDEIDFFNTKINDLVTSNTGKPIKNISYCPIFQDVNDRIFSQNSERILAAYRYASTNDIKDVDFFYRALENYRFLLKRYRDTFMGIYSVSYVVDPHIEFQASCQRYRLHNIKQVADKILTDIETLKNSNSLWVKVKKYRLHRPLQVFLFLFLIFLPDEKLL